MELEQRVSELRAKIEEMGLASIMFVDGIFRVGPEQPAQTGPHKQMFHINVGEPT